MRPTRLPAASRRGAGRFSPTAPASSSSEIPAPQPPPVRRTASPHPNRCPATAPARVVRRPPATLLGWWRGLARSPTARRIARSSAASRTCSQLSNTSSRVRPSIAAATLSARLDVRLLGDPQHGRHRLGHRGRVSDRGQLDHPHAVGEVVGQPVGNLQRQPRLAHPAGAGQRHQPMRLERLLHLDQFDSRGRRSSWRAPQIPGHRVECLQGRKLATQAFTLNLIHVDRFGDIA